MEADELKALKVLSLPEGFIRICITPPLPYDGEMERLMQLLLDGEVDFVHIRHPECGESDMRRLLESFPADLRSRLTLHDHHNLAICGLAGGIHLNSRNPELPSGIDRSKIRVSASAHSAADIQKFASLNPIYLTLSPIYDSISKQGYKSHFSLSELPQLISSTPIPLIALGGVTPAKFPELQRLRFRGAAMLGHYLKS